MVEKAIELRAQEEKGHYDQVWWVFDRDNFSPSDFRQAIDDAEAKKIKVAYSNEAFELWYLLHFQFLNTTISRKDYGVKLGKLMNKPYQKNSQSIYSELWSKQDQGIRHAEKLLAQYPQPNPAEDNPSTTVHLLVKELKRFVP